MMDFYYAPVSPQCRAIMLTAKALGVDLNKKFIDVRAGQHKTPEFTKVNPRQCIPTIVDGGFMLFEGSAIQIYLVDKYGKNDSLYPKDPQERAKVNRVLFFVSGTLQPRMLDFNLPIIRDGKLPSPESKEKVKEAVGWMNTFLQGHNFAVGNTVTIADHSAIAFLSTLKEIGADLSSCPNVVSYIERCEKNITGYDTENLPGAQKLGEFIRSKRPQ